VFVCLFGWLVGWLFFRKNLIITIIIIISFLLLLVILLKSMYVMCGVCVSVCAVIVVTTQRVCT